MCLPAAIAIPVALATATAAVSVVGQIQSANNAAKAIEAQYEQRKEQIDEKTSAEISDRLRQARREQGRIMVAAGESGVNTASPVIQGLLTDASMQATLSNQRSLANRESAREAARTEANAMMPSKPTLLGAGLQIALSGASAAQGAGAFKKG
jgi:hypothetical protein